MLKEVHANSPSPFKEKNTMDVPLKAEMMATVGVPLLRTMIKTKPMDSALKLVRFLCLYSHSDEILTTKSTNSCLMS